jgi:ABC-2 type transport system ATP-binding protein
MQRKSMIQIHNLTKKFGDFIAVDDLTLRVNAGEFFGFLGPNGAGKTTTIKVMTGLFAPTSGEVEINGYDIQREPLKAKGRLGYVPDMPFLYDKLTGREFLFFKGGLFGIDKKTLQAKIGETVDRFEMSEWVDKRTEDYSQGMRQRLTIAATLLHEPKVIIIDELLVGLDPRSARIVKDALKEHARAGGAVFMSTHSLPTAEELCDRIGIIHHGKLVFLDTLSRLREQKQRPDGTLESLFLELTKA